MALRGHFMTLNLEPIPKIKKNISDHKSERIFQIFHHLVGQIRSIVIMTVLIRAFK